MRSKGEHRRRLPVLAVAIATLAACSPEAGESNEAAHAPQEAVTPSGEPAPDAFSATAWRALAADGARYTTYLDADGTYRDLRNGDPWQTGTWDHVDSPQGRLLCFTPDHDNGVERCWEPGRMSEGTMRAESETGLSIELERVEYSRPPEVDEEPS